MMVLYKYLNMVKLEQNPTIPCALSLPSDVPVLLLKLVWMFAQYGELAISKVIALRRTAHTIL